MNELQTCIQATIRMMKRKGTTGASVDCLKQNVNTRGLTCSPEWYHANFQRVATEVAGKLKFTLMGG